MEFPSQHTHASYTKADLVNRLVYLRHVRRIQRIYRERRHRRADNDTCPITLEPLVQPMFVRRNIAKTYRRGFSLRAIAEYIVSTGKLLDPCDKEPFSMSDLKSMQELCTKNNIVLTEQLILIPTEAKQLAYKRQRESDVYYDTVGESLVEDLLDLCYDVRHSESLSFMIQDEYRSFYDFTRHCRNMVRGRGIERLSDEMRDMEHYIAEPNVTTEEQRLYVRTFMLRTLETMSNPFIHVDEPELPYGSFPGDDDMDISDDIMMTGPNMEFQINPVVTAISHNFGLMMNQHSNGVPLPFNPDHALSLPPINIMHVVLPPYGGRPTL